MEERIVERHDEEKVRNIESSEVTAAKLIAKSNDEIAKSNYEMARTILQSSQMVLAGLSSIASEMEKKRYTDEFYQLKDRIYALEDKIIDMGKNLKKVYAGMKIEFDETFEKLHAHELALLAYCFRDEDTLKKLKKAVMLTQKEPMQLFYTMLRKSSIIMVYTEERYLVKAYVPEFNVTIHLEDDAFSSRAFPQTCRETFAKAYNASGCKRLKDFKEDIQIPCTDNHIATWVLLGLSKMRKSIPDKDMEERMEDIEFFMAEMNSKATINNMRKIHEKLREAYIGFRCE